MLGSDGQSIGTSYKSLDQSLYDYAKQGAQKGIQKVQKVGVADPNYGYGGWGDYSNVPMVTRYTHPSLTEGGYDGGEAAGRLFNTEQEILDILGAGGQFSLESREKGGRPITDLQRWEELGQFINGKTDPVTDFTYHRNYGGNNQTENISGADSLYGSLPLLWGDKLMGYKMDTTPLDPVKDARWGGAMRDPYTLYAADTKGNTLSHSHMAREYNPGWEKYATKLDNDNIFVKAEDAANLPGWQNKDSSSYSHQSSGFLSKLGPIASIAAMIPGPWQLPAQMISAANALNNDNPLGAALSFAGMDFGGGSVLGSIGQAANPNFVGPLQPGALSDIGTALRGIAETTGIPASALMQGGLGALGAATQGGNPLTGGFTAGLSSLFGGQVANATGNAGLGRLGSMGASYGLNSLFNKGGQTPGSAAINQMMSSMPQVSAGGATQQEQRQPSEEELRAIKAKQNRNFALANLYRNQQNGNVK